MHQIFLATTPQFSFFSILFKNPPLLAASAPVLAVATHVVDFYGLVTVLFWLFGLDLISGLLSSYFTWKEKAPKESFFFGHKDGFSSDKFKKCFIKGMVYGGFPLIVLKFQQAFMLKSFSANYVTEAQIDVTTVILLLFCGNEIYSIFWENLPNCGINIPSSIRKFITGVKEIKEEIKN